MAMPSIDPGPWTVARFKSWEPPEDGCRYELLDGELLVTPAPKLRHQAVVGELYERLQQYARQYGLGRAIVAPLDVIVAEDTVLEPDVLLVSNRSPARREEDPTVPELLLAVEVLSPSSRDNDLRRKRLRLQQAGLVSYWVADPDARTITTWSAQAPDGQVHGETLRWRPVDGIPPLVIEVPVLFAAALDS
jgi:Uma2 family endonuclease